MRSPHCLRVFTAGVAFVFSTLLFAQDPATKPDVPTEGITVIADTRVTEGANGATIRVDMGKLTLRDLRSLTLRTPDGQELMPGIGKPMDAAVIVPSTLSQDDANAFANAVQKNLRQRYRTEDVTIKIVRFDVGEAERQALMAAQELDQAADALEDGDNKAKRLADVLKELNVRSLKQIQAWKGNFHAKLKDFHRDPESVSMLFASCIGALSSVGPVAYFLTFTGPNFFGLGQALIAIGYDQLNSTFSRRLVSFEAQHELPFWKDSYPIRFYNGKFFLKAFAVSYAINIAAASSFSFLTWLSHPSQVSSHHAVEFFFHLGGLSINSLGTAAADMGIRTLSRKHYISARTEIIMNSVGALMGQVNNMLLGTGQIDAFWFGLAIETATKFSVFMASQVLPTKGNRVWIVDPRLSAEDQKAIKYLQGVEDALMKENMDYDKIKQMVRKVEVQKGWQERGQKFIDTAQQALVATRARLEKLWAGTCKALGLKIDL